MTDKKKVNDLIVMPTRKKTKDISEIKKPKIEKAKKEKKIKLPLDKLRKVYLIVVSDNLPDFDDLSEDAERKKLIAAIKKGLK
jgi:predicted secreted acid phosphatase